MILLWLVVPVLWAIVFAVLLSNRRAYTELEEVHRRDRAMKALEELSGSQGVSDDDSQRAGWFVSPDSGRWPRRVRLVRRPTSFAGPHEPWPQEAFAGGGEE